jgi:hypothetical protein
MEGYIICNYFEKELLLANAYRHENSLIHQSKLPNPLAKKAPKENDSDCKEEEKALIPKERKKLRHVQVAKCQKISTNLKVVERVNRPMVF